MLWLCFSMYRLKAGFFGLHVFANSYRELVCNRAITALFLKMIVGLNTENVLFVFTTDIVISIRFHNLSSSSCLNKASIYGRNLSVILSRTNMWLLPGTQTVSAKCPRAHLLCRWSLLSKETSSK